MKKLVLVIILIITGIVVNAQTKLTNEQIVQNSVIDLFQALADQDLVILKKNCTADILILETGLVWNLDTLIMKVSQNTAPDYKRVNTFEFIGTEVNGKTAWTTFNNQAEVTGMERRYRKMD
jgi:hypothetical protein